MNNFRRTTCNFLETSCTTFILSSSWTWQHLALTPALPLLDTLAARRCVICLAGKHTRTLFETNEL